MDYDHIRELQRDAGFIPVVEAVISSDLEYLQWLVEQGEDINEIEDEKYSGNGALHKLVEHLGDKRYEKMLVFLLDSGADVNIKNADGENIMEYMLKKYPLNVVRACELQKSHKLFDPEYQDSSGSSYVHQVLDNSFLKHRSELMVSVLKALTSSGVSVLLQDEFGRTAMDRIPKDLKTGAIKPMYVQAATFLYCTAEEEMDRKDEEMGYNFSDIGF